MMAPYNTDGKGRIKYDIEYPMIFFKEESKRNFYVLYQNVLRWYR